MTSAVARRRRTEALVMSGLCAAAFGAFVLAGLSVLLPLFASVDLSPDTWRLVARALWGTTQIVGLALLGAVPVGILAGVFAAEIGGPLGRLARISAELLSAIPTIVVGVAAYSLVVLSLGGASRSAAAGAIGCLVAPAIARSTRALCLGVPGHLREAALSLGVPRYRFVIFVLLRTVAPGLFGAVLTSAARAVGEAAPVLFVTTFASAWDGERDDARLSALPTEVFALGSAAGPWGYGRANLVCLVLLGVVVGLGVLGRLGARRSR